MSIRKSIASLTAAALVFALAMGPAAGQRGFGGPFGPGAGPRASQPTLRRAPAISRPTVVVQPRIVASAKTSDAAKIVVIGDFLAGELADGLTDAFAQDAKFVVTDRSDGASGLARSDRVDWIKTVPQLAKTAPPDIFVVMLGVVDRQPIVAGSTRLAFHSDGWEAAYGDRIDALAAALQATGKPVFWVGLPPMKLAATGADMAYLNTLAKPRIEAAGGRFIDVWDAFSDKDGAFSATGADADGQIKQLRLLDGVSFTKAGQRKLAASVEPAIRGFGPAPEPTVALATRGGRTLLGPNGQRWLVGPSLSLTAPAPGAATILAGEGPSPRPGPQTLSYRVVIEGGTLPAVAGRADDFAWRGK